MRDTGFSVPEASLDRLATSYWTNPESGELAVYDEAEGGEWSRPPAFPSGTGGLVSTIDDYLAFGRMLGVRRLRRHQARRRGAVGRNVRLGRRSRHLLVRGPEGGADRHPADPAR